jgi:hypothetical protein
MSPLERVDVNAPPFLVVQGGNDTLVDVNVARGFVDKFRRTALAPIYYVELPFTQHAFDVTASPRTSATTRAAVTFAESVTRPRPALTSELIARYQSPPTQLLVEIAPDEWLDAIDAAVRRGPFCVVTSDNPFSEYLDGGENQSRRAELLEVLRAHDVMALPSIARDPTGEWPDEHGLALLEQSGDFATALARAFDQFAYYDVSETAVRVRGCVNGEVLV